MEENLISQLDVNETLQELGYSVDNNDYLFIQMGNSDNVTKVDFLGGSPQKGVADYYIMAGERAYNTGYTEDYGLRVPTETENDIIRTKKHYYESEGLFDYNNGINAAYIKGQGYVLTQNPDVIKSLRTKYKMNEGMGVPMSNGETFSDKDLQDKWEQVRESSSKKFRLSRIRKKANKNMEENFGIVPGEKSGVVKADDLAKIAIARKQSKR